MDVLVLVEYRVVNGELPLGFFSVATGTDGTLDLLLKLGTSPLLVEKEFYNVIVRGSARKTTASSKRTIYTLSLHIPATPVHIRYYRPYLLLHFFIGIL